MSVNILIQSNQFEAADTLIQESEFSSDGKNYYLLFLIDIFIFIYI